MSNKRNRVELEEDDYIVDEYEYPDSADDEGPTQVDHDFYLRGENFSSHGFPENDSSSSMAPGSSNSSSALSSNVCYANERSIFINGVENNYRDVDSPADNSRFPVRPPFLAASNVQQEWRYTIPDEAKPDGSASETSRGPPTRRKVATTRPHFPAADIIDVTGDDVPDQIFPQYADADQVLESYGGVDFASSHSLMGRAFTHVAYEDLAVGNVVNSFNAGVFGATHPLSLENLRAPTAQYIIVHKSDDGSSDAVRGYASCHATMLLHPKFLTFLLAPDGARRSVVVLSETAIRTRGYPSILAEVATMYQVILVGPSSRLQLAVAAAPGPLVYRSMESQRKEETLIEKLNALFVLFRGDAGAVAAFVGPSRDIGHDSVLAAIYGRLSVVQRACPWAQPDNLPLFLQLLFGETYLVVKKSGINLVCQHLMANPKPNIPFQFHHVHQLEQCRQDLCDGLTAVFCYKGSPLHKLNPQVFYKAFTGLSNQLRNTTRQNEYLVGIPINCVVQAFNAVLEDFGRYVRTKTNATIPFEEFEAGMAAALDIKPQQAVMGAYTAVSAPELFIQKQVATFDGSILPTFSGGFTVVQRQGVRYSGSVPPRFAQQHQQPSRKLQRTGPHVSAVGSNGALAVPARPPTLRPAHAVSPATPSFVTPKPPPVYICVSDFVTKLDATQFPGGCTTSACRRRHIPLPPPGQFAAADKAELLTSIGHMKGTRVAAMAALVQGRN